jgi:hypothetical protein
MLLKNIIGSLKSWSKKSKSANRKELGNIQDQDVQVIWQCGNCEDYKKYNLNAVQVVSLSKEWTLCMQRQIIISRAERHQCQSYVFGKAGNFSFS